MVNPRSIGLAWDNMLSPKARGKLSGDYKRYRQFWAQWEKVEFGQVSEGNEPNQFQAQLTYVDGKGRVQSWREVVWTLECRITVARFLSFHSCSINNVLFVDAYQPNS